MAFFSAGLSFSFKEKDLYFISTTDLWQEGHSFLREDKSKAVLGMIKGLYRHFLKTSMAKW